MLTKNQDKWIDEFSALAAVAAVENHQLMAMISKCGGGFTFVYYHAGHTPAEALDLMLKAVKGYEESKLGGLI